MYSDQATKQNWQPRKILKEDDDNMLTITQTIETCFNPEQNKQYLPIEQQTFTKIVYENSRHHWSSIPLACFYDPRFDTDYFR